MRKHFKELLAIGLIDANGEICAEKVQEEALAVATKTVEELQRINLGDFLMETCLDTMIYLFTTNSTKDFMQKMSYLFGGKDFSKVVAHLETLEELLNEEEFDGYLMEYMDYLTVKMADYIRMKIIDKNWRILSGAGGEEDGEDGL
ncbi:hypothetical protein DWX98_16055 [Blautia sp. AF22-5LB]|jgi:hypothetical protein|uniref:Uncharacterized protein n=1 Tax=Dorea formicigenerans TaxID=39486 RepID=A0A3E4MAT6_9FIRM|nr:hypothetical protein [Dorea formicigenerans]RGK46452.1 hypothetical protein DXD10_11550 [Dorea formicigenerans]RHQ74946.1 hypothetical protein DWX98_16055 [Blautia sp. AF22-5LB]